MLADADAAIARHSRDADAHQRKGEALVMLGQAKQLKYEAAVAAEEAAKKTGQEVSQEDAKLNDDLESARILTNQGIEALNKAIGLCSATDQRKQAANIEDQRFKANKVKFLTSRLKDKTTKFDLLKKLKETIEQYSNLMKNHSMDQAEVEKADQTFVYFNTKWRTKDKSFQELKVPEYLLDPIYKQIFSVPVMIACGCHFEQEHLTRGDFLQKLENNTCPDTSQNCALPDNKEQIIDYALKATCEAFKKDNPWALDYNTDGPDSGYKTTVDMIRYDIGSA